MLAGGLIALGMNWWQALLTIALGNLIVLIPILLNAHPGTKYGVPFPVLARSSFGTIGANVPALLRAIVACGWFGIQTFIGGEAVRIFLTAIWPAFNDIGGGASILGLGVPSAITFGIFWLVNIGIIVFGMNAVRVFENWSAPLILLMGVWLMVWVIMRAGGLGPMFDRPSTFATSAEFWKVFVPSLTGMIGFWATLSLNIPDFTRFGRGQREHRLCVGARRCAAPAEPAATGRRRDVRGQALRQEPGDALRVNLVRVNPLEQGTSNAPK
jgi:NCS1 family nucleobase:cation symporter-1